MTPVVLLSEPIHPDGRRLLDERAAVTVAADPTALLAHAGYADAVILRARGRLGREFFTRARRLRVVGRYGAGVDNIDLAAAAENGVTVVNTAGLNARSVAEHTVAVLLSLARRLPAQDRAVRSHDWAVRDVLGGVELAGASIGVVGFGAIGRAVASICGYGLDMRVRYHDPFVGPETTGRVPGSPASLADLLRTSDVVTVHVPLTPTTRHLIGAAQLRLMRPHALLVNVSRGAVVDEAALAAALADGTIAGAALDVFEQEPPAPDAPILSAPHTVLTPHSAALTEEAARRMSVGVVTDVLAVLDGRPPTRPVPYLIDAGSTCDEPPVARCHRADDHPDVSR
ncbi:hydroxyacid dehydrogenase [Micromonospora craniellae]|uniref:Hydroxyacid dehydrogenase n=1 Tax=Micromonospora craniellae TaxID=2294034 RepID=A0A372FSE5_9ACTN|nr:hydroxyacid dehydrogenase [Micromonospora craniellae]QOC92292.1 hydroxyacid dehydrogenase [Micromonospora craniellae]RFS43643.1 hydroxyacid dehydrogenase [Micromonospora craniellae]